MVLGKSIAVILVPLVNQCADITSTALGVGISFAICVHRRLNSVSSIPFMGEPCPTNRTGITCSCSGKSLVNLLNAGNVAIPIALVAIVFMNCFLSIEQLCFVHYRLC